MVAGADGEEVRDAPRGGEGRRLDVRGGAHEADYYFNHFGGGAAHVVVRLVSLVNGGPEVVGDGKDEVVGGGAL